MNLLWEAGRVSLSPHGHTQIQTQHVHSLENTVCGGPEQGRNTLSPPHPWLTEGQEHGTSLSVPLPCIFEQVTRPVGALASYPSNEMLIPQTCRKLWFSHAMVLASSWTLVQAAGY